MVTDVSRSPSSRVRDVMPSRPIFFRTRSEVIPGARSWRANRSQEGALAARAECDEDDAMSARANGPQCMLEANRRTSTRAMGCCPRVGFHPIEESVGGA